MMLRQLKLILPMIMRGDSGGKYEYTEPYNDEMKDVQLYEIALLVLVKSLILR
jgi:hypothetical protein